MPTSGLVTLPVPNERQLQYSVLTITGQMVGQGSIESANGSFIFDLGMEQPGLYIIRMTDEEGRLFRAKIIKE